MRSWHRLLVALGFVVSALTVHAQPAASLGLPAPAASLVLPSSTSSTSPPSPPSSFLRTPVVRAASPTDPLVGDYSPAARLGNISDVRFGPGQAADAPLAPSVPTTPEERYNWGIPDALAPSQPSTPRPQASQSYFGQRIGEYFNREGGHSWTNFQSDHCFDDFISPMSNPFLAEDPRALTEIRPILIFQTIPHGSAANGGNLEFFGLRGSVAFTERFSITLDKIGGLVLNPGSGSLISGGSGFTEIWLGPKYTFYRNEQSGTIAAAGAIFQIPTGPSKIFQDTGDLSIVPYGTVAQKFGKTSWGTFQVLDTAGFAASVNNQRSNYIYNTLHLDFDVANYSRIYPLIELNWFCYTSNGQARTLDIEGADIANVGSAVAGRNYLNLAFGSRFKVTEAVQLGIAAEFPLLNSRDLYNFRLGFDVIWRY